MSKPKLFVLYEKSGCCFWRVWQPTQFLMKMGLADVRYSLVRDLKTLEVVDNLRWCDFVLTTGLIGTNELSLLKRYQELGKKVCVDYDDLYFNLSPFNPAYKHLGTDEVRTKDTVTGEEKYLWKDGVNGFNLKQNKLKFHSYVAILQEADLITTTTVYLKEAMAQISGREDNIKVLPNAIDLSQWKPVDVRDKFKDTFRFGWAVSDSHAPDWRFIAPVVKDFLNHRMDAKFVVIGETSDEVLGQFPKEQVECYTFSNLWEGHYSYRMPMLGLDCAIAPLADLEFNKCKSPLKYEEYTAFGWPVVAQNMTPYKEHIIHGETGLLASDASSWLYCLDAMYSDKNRRMKLQFNAMHTVRELFDMKKVAQEWADVYSGVLV